MQPAYLSIGNIGFNEDPKAALLYNESMVASGHNLSTMDDFYLKRIRGELGSVNAWIMSYGVDAAATPIRFGVLMKVI